MTSLSFEKVELGYASSVIPAGTAKSITIHFNFPTTDRTMANNVAVEGTISEENGWSILGNVCCSDVSELTLNNIPSSQSIRVVCDKMPDGGMYEINS